MGHDITCKRLLQQKCLVLRLHIVDNYLDLVLMPIQPSLPMNSCLLHHRIIPRPLHIIDLPALLLIAQVMFSKIFIKTEKS